MRTDTDVEEQFLRTAMLLGEEAIARLQKAHVAVFGLGGVGGYAVEALARGGIGALDLVDNDTVGESNLNRQLFALRSTLGLPKTEAARRRVLDINPGITVKTWELFYSADTADAFDLGAYDYIVDAIDTVSAKLLLIERAVRAQTPVISSMGTGNKLDPSLFRVEDLAKTSMDPLARVMRRELGKRGIKHVKVVWSPEEALTPQGGREEAERIGKRQIPGSVSFVPGAAGLILAGEVIRHIAGKN